MHAEPDPLGIAAGPRDGGRLRVLDVGCGRTCPPDIPADAHVTGIDLEPDGMELNPRLEERLIGDIQTFSLHERAYDLVVCRDVLEHLPDPVAALRNMAAALAPGGELRLRAPYVLSRKSLVAKFTPHRFHVWAYRHVFGFERAGEPGYGPFPTVLRWVLHPRLLRSRAEAVGLELVSFERETGAAFATRPLLRLLVGGQTECSFVFRRVG